MLCSCVSQATQPSPPPPETPTATVLLLSKEGHTGLLFPDRPGHWTEYAFGDYGWYVEERGGPGWGLYSIIADSAGALGRRRVVEPLMEDRFLRERVGELYPFQVPAADLARLRARLDAEFAHGGASVYNPRFGLHFVLAQESYSMWFNCADATAEWLREIGVHASTRGICKRIRGERGMGWPLPGISRPAER